MAANGSAFFRYAMKISIQKLIEGIKSNTAGFQGTMTQNTKENTKMTTEINFD